MFKNTQGKQIRINKTLQNNHHHHHLPSFFLFFAFIFFVFPLPKNKKMKKTAKTLQNNQHTQTQTSEQPDNHHRRTIKINKTLQNNHHHHHHTQQKHTAVAEGATPVSDTLLSAYSIAVTSHVAVALHIHVIKLFCNKSSRKICKKDSLA